MDENYLNLDEEVLEIHPEIYSNYAQIKAGNSMSIDYPDSLSFSLNLDYPVEVEKLIKNCTIIDEDKEEEKETIETVLEKAGYKHFNILEIGGAKSICLEDSDTSYVIGDYIEGVRFNKNKSPICIAGEIFEIEENCIAVQDIEYNILYRIMEDGSYIK